MCFFICKYTYIIYVFINKYISLHCGCAIIILLKKSCMIKSLGMAGLVVSVLATRSLVQTRPRMMSFKGDIIPYHDVFCNVCKAACLMS